MHTHLCIRYITSPGSNVSNKSTAFVMGMDTDAEPRVSNVYIEINACVEHIHNLKFDDMNLSQDPFPKV